MQGTYYIGQTQVLTYNRGFVSFEELSNNDTIVYVKDNQLFFTTDFSVVKTEEDISFRVYGIGKSSVVSSALDNFQTSIKVNDTNNEPLISVDTSVTSLEQIVVSDYLTYAYLFLNYADIDLDTFMVNFSRYNNSALDVNAFYTALNKMTLLLKESCDGYPPYFSYDKEKRATNFYSKAFSLDVTSFIRLCLKDNGSLYKFYRRLVECGVIYTNTRNQDLQHIFCKDFTLGQALLLVLSLVGHNPSMYQKRVFDKVARADVNYDFITLDNKSGNKLKEGEEVSAQSGYNVRLKDSANIITSLNISGVSSICIVPCLND